MRFLFFERSALRAWASPYALLTGGLIFIQRRNGDGRRRMDRLLCAAFWRVSERVWDDDAVILLGGIADWQSFCADRTLRRVREADLVLSSLFVAGAGLVVILVGSSLMTVSSGAGLTGLGLAAVFPHYSCDLHPAFREAGVATDWILLCAGPAWAER